VASDNPSFSPSPVKGAHAVNVDIGDHTETAEKVAALGGKFTGITADFGKMTQADAKGHRCPNHRRHRPRGRARQQRRHHQAQSRRGFSRRMTGMR
jgi:hypothetical protein